MPTGRLRERVGDVARRVREAGWDVCVVVGDDGVVLGLLGAAVLGGGPATVAKGVPRSSPPTVRTRFTVVQRSDAERSTSGLREHAVPS